MGESGPDRPLRNYPDRRYAQTTTSRTKPEDAVRERKARFDRLNADIIAMGAWVISVAGDRRVTVECLPDSAIPEALKAAGYKLFEIAAGERILPTAIEEQMTRNADGTLSPLTEGSTQPVTLLVHHAGIARTRRWEFLID